MKNKLPVKILAILLSCGLLTVGVGARFKRKKRYTSWPTPTAP